MGLLDEVRSEPAPQRRTKLDQIRETLSEDDFNDFMTALCDPSISQVAIVRALEKRGIHIAKGTISEMRTNQLRLLRNEQ